MTAKNSQMNLFGVDDTPLFSNTPTRAKLSVFKPETIVDETENQMTLDDIDTESETENLLIQMRQINDRLNQLYADPMQRPNISQPSDVVIMAESMIAHDDSHEQLWVMSLDTRHRIRKMEMIYRGTVNQSNVRIAEILRTTIKLNCPAMIVFHNHPSGDTTPSPDDIAVTRQIKEACQLFDIDLVDHIIIAVHGAYTSLKARGIV